MAPPAYANPLLFGGLQMLGAGLEGRPGIREGVAGAMQGYQLTRQQEEDERLKRQDQAIMALFQPAATPQPQAIPVGQPTQPGGPINLVPPSMQGGIAGGGGTPTLAGGPTGGTGNPTLTPSPVSAGQGVGSGNYTQAGRQIYTSPTGERFSERSITVTHPGINGGAPTNIPSVFGGQTLSEPEAVQRIIAAGGRDPETGRALPGFGSIAEAEQAARARSASLGPVGNGGGLTFASFVRQNQGLGPLLMAVGREQRGPLLANMFMQARNQRAPNRPTARNAAGYLVYTDTGERVDPSAVAPAPKGTSAQQNAAALGLTPGTPEYDAYIRQVTTRPASTVNVNTGPAGIDYGKPPTDYAWARDAQGNVLLEDTGNGQMAPVAVPVVGGPAAREIAAEQEAEAAGAQQKQQTSDLMLDEIDRAIALAERPGFFPTVGTVGGLLSNLSETDAGALRGILQTIRANIGFDRLQQMREASPTGGALGQVSEGEIARLESVMGNLEQSQRDDIFLYNMNRLRDAYLDAIHGVGNRPDETTGRPTDYSGMTAADLAQVDTSQLGADDLRAYLQRTKELQDGM